MIYLFVESSVLKYNVYIISTGFFLTGIFKYYGLVYVLIFSLVIAWFMNPRTLGQSQTAYRYASISSVMSVFLV